MNRDMSQSLDRVLQNLRETQRVLAGKPVLTAAPAREARKPAAAAASSVDNHLNEAVLSFRSSMSRLKEMRERRD